MQTAQDHRAGEHLALGPSPTGGTQGGHLPREEQARCSVLPTDGVAGLLLFITARHQWDYCVLVHSFNRP